MAWADRLATSAIASALAIVCGSPAFALNPALDVDQYAHTAWLLREGFAQGRVTAVAQTPDGYLWLGTELGLLRFDGIRAVRWNPPGGARLPSRWIRTLLAAPDGTLWIGTLAGLASWRDGKLEQYSALAEHSVHALLADREGTVWAGGYAGPTGSLCAIRSGKAACETTGFGQWVGSLYEDHSGVLWATAQNGLWRWRPGAPRHYPEADSANGSSQTLLEDDRGRLLIAGQDGIRQFADDHVVPYPLPGVGGGLRPERLLRDRHGALWIGTLDHGLLHVHQGRTDVYTQANGLSGDFITRLFEDREGNIWVATKNGLDRFRDLAVRTIAGNQGLPSPPPWSVLAARDGSIWLGTLDGVSRFKDGRFTIYRSAKRRARPPGGRAADGDEREVLDSGLPDDGVGTLYEDGDGRLWVTTLRGVAYFEDGRFVTVGQLPSGRTPLIAGDGDRNLWIANDAHGLYRFRGGTVVEQLPWTTFDQNEAATALLPDPGRGGLWLGFPGRVVHVRDGTILESYTVADGLGGGRVNDLRLDRDGALWVATENGLSRVRNQRLATVRGANGLPCDGVHWSVADGDWVWLYMECGLVRVPAAELRAAVDDRATRIVTTTLFDSSDGVALRPLPTLYRPQVARTDDGRLWFLPGDGVGVLDTHDLSTNMLPPPVRIEQVTADRRTYGATGGLRLPPRVRDLEIDYTALSFAAPEKNRFRVKLEGRDGEWQDVGHRRQAMFADLAPGTYRFRVTAANNSGVWNESGAFVDFSIAPAYYQTTWFRVASLTGLLMLCWVAYRVRMRQISRTFNLRLDERVNERTRIARELHDTLLQSFQGLMLHFQSARDLLPANPVQAVDELDHALERADRALLESRDAIQNLRASTVAVNDLTQVLTALADEFAQGPLSGQAAAGFRVTVEGTPRALHPMVRDEVYRIAREALRNAFHHADAGHIEAEVTYGVRELRVRVRDDGKGIDPQYLPSGRAHHWGLVNMRERAEAIGSELSLWSEVGAGTEVELRIPGAIAYGASHRHRPGGSPRTS